MKTNIAITIGVIILFSLYLFGGPGKPSRHEFNDQGSFIEVKRS